MKQKQDPVTNCLQETHFHFKDIYTESERMEKGSPCKWTHTQAGEAIHIPDKIDLMPMIVTRDKGHFIMINISINWGDIIFINMFALNIGATKYVTNINGSKGRNRQHYHNRRGQQYLIFNNGQIIKTEN